MAGNQHRVRTAKIVAIDTLIGVTALAESLQVLELVRPGMITGYDVIDLLLAPSLEEASTAILAHAA